MHYYLTYNYILPVFHLFYGTVVVVWYLDLQLPVQSVPITANVVSSNPVRGEVYSIQYYVINFVCDLRQVGSFPGTPVSSTNKTDRHDITTKILLKVALNIISQTKPLYTKYNVILSLLISVFYWLIVV